MIKSALQSSLTNDVKYNSMSVGNLPSSEYLITSTIVGATPVSNVEFDVTSLGSQFKHLVIVYASLSTVDTWLAVRLNGDATAANYRSHRLMGESGSVTSSALNGTTNGMQLFGLTGSSSVPGSGVIDILDAFSTNKNKTLRSLTRGPNTIALTSGLYISTNILTTVRIINDGGNFAQHSRFSLYGVV